MLPCHETTFQTDYYQEIEMDVEHRVSSSCPHFTESHCASLQTDSAQCDQPADPIPSHHPPDLFPPGRRWSRRWQSLKSVLNSRKVWQQTMAADEDQARPSIGRMKDSDDYITARAANPRTGLVSPSPYSSTPNSPGDALNLRRRTTQQETRSHAVRRRPVLAKANEGRRVSGHSAREGVLEHGHCEASYNMGQCRALNLEEAQGELQEDQFVVHMPSAREPQPFTYPGYTAEQIEALEHYRCKARRVSSEGYDRRRFCDRSTAAIGSEQVIEAPSQSLQPFCYRRPFTPYTAGRLHDEPGSPEPPRILVRKRNSSKVRRILQHSQPKVGAQSHDIDQGLPPVLGPRSPKTSVPQRSAVQIHCDVPATVRNINQHAEKSLASVIGSGPKLYTIKAIDSSPPSRRPSTHDEDLVDQYTRIRSPPSVNMHAIPGAYTDLSQLPSVRLVRPEHAAVPRMKAKNRQCSLGCQGDDNQQGRCTQRRSTSNGTVVRSGSLLFRRHVTPEERPPVNFTTEQLLGYFLQLANYLGSLQLPRIGLLELLRDPEVSTKEKTQALRAILSLAGHALTICTLLAMLWKVGTALKEFCEVVLWPLALPLRLIKCVLVG